MTSPLSPDPTASKLLNGETDEAVDALITCVDKASIEEKKGRIKVVRHRSSSITFEKGSHLNWHFDPEQKVITAKGCEFHERSTSF